MKKFFTAVLFVLSTSVFSNEIYDYKILEGKLHKGGELHVAIEEAANPQDNFKVVLNYKIIKKNLVPVPNEYLQGEYIQELPIAFLDERGYLELERVGEMQFPEAKVKFMGRRDVGPLKNAMLIKLLPTNGKSIMNFVYSPQVPGLGWDNLELIIRTRVPLLGDYLLEGKMI
jgi:hypothetical protein